MIEVNSFKDRCGNKVVIGDFVGYFHAHSVKLIRSGRVVRITKSGYFISVYIEGQKHPWYKMNVEKIFND